MARCLLLLDGSEEFLSHSLALEANHWQAFRWNDAWAWQSAGSGCGVLGNRWLQSGTVAVLRHHGAGLFLCLRFQIMLTVFGFLLKNSSSCHHVTISYFVLGFIFLQTWCLVKWMLRGFCCWWLLGVLFLVKIYNIQDFTDMYVVNHVKCSCMNDRVIVQ